MSELVEYYVAHVSFPEVSGAEHLEMLKLRDKIFEIEATLTVADKSLVAAADRHLIDRGADLYAELSRFIDFEARRKNQQIPPTRWWYSDVLVQPPNSLPAEREVQVVTSPQQ